MRRTVVPAAQPVVSNEWLPLSLTLIKNVREGGVHHTVYDLVPSRRRDLRRPGEESGMDRDELGADPEGNRPGGVSD